MFLSSWRKLMKLVRRNDKASRRKRGRFQCDDQTFRWLWLELLEDRTLLSTFKWLGGSSANWNDSGNWSLLSGSGAFPNAQGDVAQFTGTYSTAQTATV